MPAPRAQIAALELFHLLLPEDAGDWLARILPQTSMRNLR
jgi:hypothetical protein